MDILEREGIRFAFFGVKTYRDALDGSDIVHRTDLVKIGQCDVAVFLIDLYRRDGGRDLLDQGKPQFRLALVRVVYEFFQGGSPESS